MTETVVSSRVVGSANPILKKINEIKSAFGGVVMGLVFLVVGFVMIWMVINGVKENSKAVGALSLISAENVKGNEGLAKVEGQPAFEKSVSYAYTLCKSKECYEFQKTQGKEENLLYYSVSLERFEVVKKVTQETRTRTENGQEIEDTIEKVEYKEEWVKKSEVSDYGEMKLGNLKVVLSGNTNLMLDRQSKTIPNVFLGQIDPINTYGQTVSATVGTTRAVMDYITLPQKNVIAVGEVNSNQMSSGDPFIVTDKSDAELVKQLKSNENTQRTMYALGSWFFIFIGFGMIFAPIIELIDWIPLFGWAAKTASGILSFILATAIVLVGLFALKFWYLCLGGLILLLVGGVAMMFMKMGKPKEVAKTKEE